MRLWPAKRRRQRLTTLKTVRILKPTQYRMEMKKLAHEEDMDDGISMEWISPKRLAELKEKYRENPPSPEQQQQMREFLKMVAADSEERRRKKSGK